MAIPTVDQLLQPTLDALRAQGGTAAIPAITDHVLAALQLPPEEAAERDPRHNMTRVEYRLAWARTYLKKYGLAEDVQRGVWALTEKGRATPQVDPKEVVAYINVLKKQARVEAGEMPKAVAVDSQPDDIPEAVLVQELSPTGEPVRSLTPHLPDNTSVRHFLTIMDGVSESLFHAMHAELVAQRGNPQETVDWADPDEWIPERLSNEQQALALRLWRESKHTVNPRHSRGAWTLAARHNLIAADGDVLRLTDRGRQFIANPAGPVAAEIDGLEGTTTVLRLVAEKGPGWRGEFLPGFTEFCHAYTTLRSDNAVKHYLYTRLTSLVERGYVTRRGLTYEITDLGLGYLDTNGTRIPGPPVVAGRRSDIHKLAKELRQKAREQLADFLVHMNPFKFEELIKLLLEEMGYEDVVTTAPTNDKGVDVVAHIELGISSVREVIQVKRHKGSLNRTVLDQLRGSLHRFSAVRGTVISTGKFSKGAQEAAFERGAAPITLIDGDKLLDLLTERQIGVTKKSVDYYEFDPAKLVQFEQEAGANGVVG